jgi:hypothetical protein
MAIREADLSLRGTSWWARPRLHWPAGAQGDDAPIAVFLSDLDVDADSVTDLCRSLANQAELIVLSVRTSDLHAATVALEWTADHAHELGADAEQVVVAGICAGGCLAARAALHARDEGWPPLARQILIRPMLTDPLLWVEPLEGAAPATVVQGRFNDGARYAARLREAGVDVKELRDGPGLDTRSLYPR